MSKESFINNVIKEIGLDVPYTTERGLVVTPDKCSSDKININIKSANAPLTKDKIKQISNIIYDNSDKMNSFIDSYFGSSQVNGNMLGVYFGYSDNKKEIYFETVGEFDEMNNFYPVEGLSYDESNNFTYKYSFLMGDSIDKAIDLFLTKANVPNLKDIVNFGFVKTHPNENERYYLLLNIPFLEVYDSLLILSKNINPNNTNIIDEYFSSNKDKTISYIAYKIENNNLNINIYTK
jgi:hypothetical protein